MTAVYGHIKVKETDEPISGLVVGVYTGKPEASPKVQTKMPDPFQAYPRSLGSTITDAEGKFRIEFEVKPSVDAAKKEQEMQGAILAVLAPSSAESMDILAASTPFNRLLHCHELPGLDAGQTEASVVRLFEKQLEKFDLNPSRNQYKHNIEQSVARLVEAEQDNIRFSSLLREKLAPIRKEKVKQQQKIAEAAKKFAAPVYATPKAARSKSNWVPFKADTTEAVRATIKEGLLDFAKANARKPAKIEARLSDNAIVMAGMDPNRFDRFTVEGLEIDHEQLCILLNSRRGGPEMVHVRNLLEARKTKIVPDVLGMSRAAAEEAIIAAGLTVGTIGIEYNEAVPLENIIRQEPLSGTLTTPGMVVNLVVSAQRKEVPTEADESALAVSRRVLGQIRDMPVADAAVSSEKSQPLTADELNAMLPDVRLGSGPADVSAFHDFYHLQIAFPHVWTEAFDEHLRNQIESAYNAIVQLHEEYGIKYELPEKFQEINEIRDLVNQIRQQAYFLDEPVPQIVRDALKKNAPTRSEWNQLSTEEQNEVRSICEQIFTVREVLLRISIVTGNGQEHTRLLQQQIESVNQVRTILAKSAVQSAGQSSRLIRTLEGIVESLTEPYSFHYFAPNTVNFGLLTTYRQEWQPGPYQVGDLVSSIPLAPGEKRKYTTKQVVKSGRAQTELEKSLVSKSRDMTTTRRVEAEITAKASVRSNFQMTSEGAFRFAIGEISAGTQFSTDQEQESSSRKQDFREAVLKAAQEYKQERSLEVKTTDELTSESTTSGELTNPNNELTVTYLLYELERQYRISERIHRVTPVVLVAQDVPAPHEITESWLLTHEWILHRVLLDDSLAVALDYLTDAFAGEELSVSVKKANWEMQVGLVKDLEGSVKGFKTSRDELRDMLINIDKDRSMSEIERKRIIGKAARLGYRLSELREAGETADELKVDMEEQAVIKKAVESRLDYLEDKLKESQERLVSVEETLNQATKAYTGALESQTNRRVAIDQLRIHIKQNILYYMQAIWDHEPPDQRFFRLYHIDVDLPEAPERTCTLRRATEEEEASGIPLVERDGKLYIIENCEPPTLPAPGSNKKRLVEIADLDRPLGYKGNYMIFPLKTCLYLTDFMMRDYFDDYFGVRDPDLAANFSVEELIQYTEELMRDETEKLTKEQREALQRMVMTKLRQPRRDSDLVVVPTGELFMEALLGEHTLLENFKLKHRAVDAAKARAEWRGTELENLRRAARLLQEEPNLEDPDVDKKIVVEGDSDVHVETS